MSDTPQGADWWLADDGKWYPPDRWTGPPGSKPPINDVFRPPATPWGVPTPQPTLSSAPSEAGRITMRAKLPWYRGIPALLVTGACLFGAGFLVRGVVDSTADGDVVAGDDNAPTTTVDCPDGTLTSDSGCKPIEDAETRPTSAPTTTVAPTLQLGQEGRSAGTVVTLRTIRESPTLPREARRSMGGPEVVDAPAEPGAKYVIVEATVLNDGLSSIDLTCGYPIDNKLVDAGGRQFDAVNQLYELPGNRECNDSLQPGFSSPMTWAYSVPVDMAPAFWGMRESSFGSSGAEGVLEPVLWSVSP